MKEALVFLVVLPIALLVVFNNRVQEFVYEPAAGTATPVVVGRGVAAVAAPVPTPDRPGVPGGATSVPAALFDAARSWLGVPYLWGGCSRRGVDCSCFVANALAAIGIQAPRTTTTQVAWATPVSRDAMQPGDLVFFDNTCTNCGPNPTHVGLYLGGGMMIDAGDPVRIEPVYWNKFHSAGRPRGL